MVFKINRFDHLEVGSITLALQGALTADYVDILEAEFSTLLSEPRKTVWIDLRELTFLDEAGAAILARLKERPGVCLSGSELFTQEMIDSAGEEEGNHR